MSVLALLERWEAEDFEDCASEWLRQVRWQWRKVDYDFFNAFE